MGDRAMAEIKVRGGSMFLYTHWGGSTLFEDAKKAVTSAKNRWNDESYATRIIIDRLTIEGRDSETGFGIMLKPFAEDEYNNDEPSVIINLAKQTISQYRDGTETAQISFADLTK